MNDTNNIQTPVALEGILAASETLGFTLSCDSLTGALLRTLAASKPGGRFLEIGTGTGASTAWLLDGMDEGARLLTVEVEGQRQGVAREHLRGDARVTFRHEDAKNVLLEAQSASFDFIFADTWVSKQDLLDETLALVKRGGLYVIDDMLPVPGWGPDMPKKVPELMGRLERRQDLHITKLNWSTGLIVCAKK